MRWGRWGILAAALLSVASAHANTVLIDGFETTDTAGTSPLCEDGTCAGVWTETLAGGAVTGDLALCTQSASCVVHASINGGAATSKHSLKLNIASGETAYYSLGSAVSLNESQYADHVCVYVTGTPTTATRIHEHREGANLGCYVQLNTDNTLTVKDGTGNTYGSTSKIMETSYCASSSNDCTVDQDCLDASKGDVCVSSKCQNIRTPCHDNTPCPTGQTCVGCTTATGAGCYFGCHELVTTTFGSTRLCELAWGGTVLVTGAPQTASTANVTDVRIGATTNPGASGLTAYFDDYVGVGGDDRTHMSLVERTCPATDGTPLTWSRNSCGGAGTHEQCIDDYCTGSFLLGSGFLNKSKIGQEETFSAVDALTFDDATSVRAVETQLIGSQSSTNAYAMDHKLLLYDGSSYTDMAPTLSASSGTGSTTNRILLRGVYDETGIAGSQSWSAGRLAQLGSRVVNATGNNANARLHAQIMYVQVTRADSPAPMTLCQNDGDTSDIEDHNYGTNDGKCVIAAIGDSTAYGTLSVQCQNSTVQDMCSQDDYCSFDAVAAGGNADLPTGGCHADDAVCQTCANRHEDFNGGAGLPCGPSNGSVSCDQCGSATDDAVTAGCCSGGVCDGSEGISCTTDADCVLGDCSTCTDGDCTAQTPTATCELSCPGSGTACTVDSQCSGGQQCNTDWGVCTGTCPTARASWPAYLPQVVSADVILQCGQGSETLSGMVQNRLESIVATGQNATAASTGPCVAVQGSGQCECSSGSDCGTGGACTSGRCTAGDTTRTACTELANCASGKRCLFYPPDYIIVHEGYNDFLQTKGDSPSCIGPQSLLRQTTGSECANCPATTCVADATCASRSADSECGGHAYGFLFTGTDYPCSANRLAAFPTESLCLLRSNGCRQDSDCEVSGQTCTGYTSGNAKSGWCDCGADDPNPATNCPSGYSCLNGRCRLACTADANCGTGGNCDEADSVCYGLCTCPSNSSDQTNYPNAAACTTDADCPNFGTCSGGACICGGAPLCFGASDTCRTSALRRWNSMGALYAGLDNASGPAGMDHLPYWVRQAERIVNAPPDADGRPVLMFASLLDSGWDATDCTGRPRFIYHTFRKQLASMLTFPHYIDSFRTFAINPTDDLFVDNVHPGATGAQLMGQTSVGAFLNSLNVCATDAGTERATAQGYCKNTTGTFSSTTCTTVAECSAGQTCERRPCSQASDCPDASDSCNLETGAL